MAKGWVKRLKKKVKKHLTERKAKEILRHGEVHGKPITEKQKGYFGVIAGGKTPRIGK